MDVAQWFYKWDWIGWVAPGGGRYKIKHLTVPTPSANKQNTSLCLLCKIVESDVYNDAVHERRRVLQLEF